MHAREMEICKLQSDEMRHLPAIPYMVMWAVDRFTAWQTFFLWAWLLGVRVGVATVRVGVANGVTVGVANLEWAWPTIGSIDRY